MRRVLVVRLALVAALAHLVTACSAPAPNYEWRPATPTSDLGLLSDDERECLKSGDLRMETDGRDLKPGSELWLQAWVSFVSQCMLDRGWEYAGAES